MQYSTKERALLARLMRAEALGEGNLGMLMGGNVIINRALANCLTFKDSSLFNGNPTTNELNLDDRILRGEYYHPATDALWFYAPSGSDSCKATWWEQELAGRYKNHCFYQPDPGVCIELH